MLILVLAAALASAQQETGAPSQAPAASQQPAAPATSGPSHMPLPPGATQVKLLIAAGDEGDISVYGVPDLNTKFRVNSLGMITFPLLGEVKFAGLSADEAQAMLEQKLVDAGLLRTPHVSVFVKEYSSQAISIMGEVAKPGVYPITSSHRLYDVLLLAGGMTQRAGNTISITHAGEADKPVVVSVSQDPAKIAATSVDVLPGDTIVVSKAGMIYVLGEVNRPGAYVIENRQDMTLLQVLSMSAGTTRTAALGNAKILRRTDSGLKSVAVDLKKLLQAKANDMPLQPEDILYVPASGGKAALERGGSSVLSMLTSLAIYRF